jgi:hypothetical protein
MKDDASPTRRDASKKLNASIIESNYKRMHKTAAKFLACPDPIQNSCVSFIYNPVIGRVRLLSIDCRFD